MNQIEFLGFAIHDLISNGITVKIHPTYSIGKEGEKFAGEFDGNTKTLEFASARPDWFEIFIHEYCHSLQWKDGFPEEEGEEEGDGGGGDEEGDTLWDWVAHRGNVSDEAGRAACDEARYVEAENEGRVVALLRANDFGIDIPQYIQKSNAYAMFYNYLKKHRRWVPRGPYTIPQIVERMPSDAVRDTDELYPWFEEMVDLYCMTAPKVETAEPEETEDVPASLNDDMRLPSIPSELTATPSAFQPESFAAFHALRGLEDNWDDEGAPRPSEQALARSLETLNWANSMGFAPTDIDADVLGGVGIRFTGPAGREAWVSILNSGRESVFMKKRESLAHQTWDDEAKRQVAAFLSEPPVETGI